MAGQEWPDAEAMALCTRCAQRLSDAGTAALIDPDGSSDLVCHGCLTRDERTAWATYINGHLHKPPRAVLEPEITGDMPNVVGDAADRQDRFVRHDHKGH
jgi:hypothetical protein